jgi:hypothetical protein
MRRIVGAPLRLTVAPRFRQCCGGGMRMGVGGCATDTGGGRSLDDPA